MVLKQSPKQLVEYVSFSGIKDWQFCPHYYKLTRIDKVYKFQGNIHTAFGTAVHTVLEHMVLERKNKQLSHLVEASKRRFLKEFKKELASLPKDVEVKEKDVLAMEKQAMPLIAGALPALDEYFGPDYELLSSEEQINIEIEEYKLADYDFRGIVDLAIKSSDGKVHIIDWKTCSWGWNFKKKTDPMTTYQLTYYKHFFAKKHKIELKNIETYFILLKRTAKKDNIEIVRVTSGDKKRTNALTLLEHAVHNIDHANFVKNKTSCKTCAVWKTLCEG